MVDIIQNKNSYFKMQLLQSDSSPNEFTLFQTWGRIGTSIGSMKNQSFFDETQAIEAFELKFYELTNNAWEDRRIFVKMPSSYYLVEVDYDNINIKLNVSKKQSLLPDSVIFLTTLLFDLEIMKKINIECKLDIEKMPLGKPPKNLLEQGRLCLKSISTILSSRYPDQNKLISECNKFYHLVPHNFGIDCPELISTKKMVAEKNELLRSLVNIENSYEMLVNTKILDIDQIVANYQKLNADIVPLDKNDEYYKLIESYLKNTHGITHNDYELHIIQIFKVTRHEEIERFKKFAHNENRMLLWHGSSLANYLGIISKGLRIAPSQVPVHGSMFGRGVYFTDSVSKSANYCDSNKYSNTGLLLLSEVALGNWQVKIN